MSLVARMTALKAGASNLPLQDNKPGRKPRLTDESIKEMHSRNLSIPAMMAEAGVSRGTIDRMLRKNNLWLGKGRRRSDGTRQEKRPEKRSEKRHPGFDIMSRSRTMLPINSPAVAEGRTIFPTQVISAEGASNVLIEGKNSSKIGGEIIKGRWSGIPIFTLTLEERKTCPDSCPLYVPCYGNNMNYARRIAHDSKLEARLGVELCLLQFKYPKGFAVRLHVLGDFYSVDYVRLWASFIESFPALHVFGFTARIDRKDPIAAELVSYSLQAPDRWCIRFSNAPIDEWSTVVIDHPRQVPADAILCPAQTGKTESCSTCALCWQTNRRIAFLRH